MGKEDGANLAITNDEANLYDRQIRLWGVDAQNRLRKSSVLLIGLNLLGAEVAKNLILSGIKRLDLIDSRALESANRHFLTAYVGNDSAAKDTKVAQACLANCRALNPLVEVQCIDLESIDEDSPPEKWIHLDNYDLVCFIDFDRVEFNLQRIQRLNMRCRKNNVKFVTSGCFGFFAYCFFDFQHFEYYQEVQMGENKEAETSGPEAKRSKIEAIPEKSLVKKIEQFVSMEEALKETKVEPENLKKIRKLPAGFYQFQIVNRFYEQSKDDRSESDQLQSIYETLVADWASSLRDLTFDIPRFSSKRLVGLSSPVCAIMGGIVSQQIIQALSQNEQPINNFVFYDGYDCAVCKLPID